MEQQYKFYFFDNGEMEYDFFESEEEGFLFLKNHGLEYFNHAKFSQI